MKIDAHGIPRHDGSRVPGWDEPADLTKEPAVVPDPATTPVPAELQVEIEDYMSRYPDSRSAAIPALRAAQRRHGWLSPTAVEQVATVMRLTPGYLIAVATFYDMFETSPVGEHTIYVCTNISCSLRNADRVYERIQAAAGGDERFNVRAFECLGACDIAPMASVDGTYIGPLTEDDGEELITALRERRVPLPEKHIARRPIAATLYSSDSPRAPEGEPAGGASAEGRTSTRSDKRGDTDGDAI